MDLPLDCCSGSGEALVDLPRCARRGFRCAPRLRRAPQSGDAHSKRATGPLWIPRRESLCDPALRAGTLSGAAFGGKNRERVPPRGGFGFSALRTDGLFRAPPGRSRCAVFGGGNCRVPPRRRFSICRAAPGGALDALLACGERRRAATRIQRGPQAPFGFPVGSRHATRPEGPES